MTRAATITLAFGLALAAGPAAAQSLSQAEVLQLAKDACRAKDFSQMFGYFAQNDGVRAALTAPEVQIRSLTRPGQLQRTVRGAEYRDFKIAMIDYSFFDAESADRFDAGQSEALEALKLDITEEPGGAYRVAYVKAEYGPPGEDEEYGELIRTYGQPGAYLFERREDCWQLTQDFR
jgi:hypothetical protein